MSQIEELLTIVSFIKEYVEKYPNTEVILETPRGTLTEKLGNTLIYVGQGGCLVIDSE